MKFKSVLTAVLITALSVCGTVGAYAEDITTDTAQTAAADTLQPSADTVQTATVSDAVQTAPTAPAVSTADAAASDGVVKVYLNGHLIEYTSGNYARIMNDRTMVPIRTTAEELGMTVDWDGTTNTMTFTRDDNVITHVMCANTMTINGETKTYEAYSAVVNNSTYMPLIMLADVTGLEPTWEPKSKSVFLAPASQEAVTESEEEPDDEEVFEEETEETTKAVEKATYGDGDIKLQKYIKVDYDTGKDMDGGRARNYVYAADNDGFVVANLYNELYINMLDKDYNVTQQKRIYKDGFEIGGYFFYNNYHYVLFGRSNSNEQNSTVYRLTQYNTSFEQVRSINVMGDSAKIAEPFRKGKVDMIFDGNILTVSDVGLRYKENNKNSDCNVIISFNLRDFKLMDVDITSEDNSKSVAVRNSGLGQKIAYISDNSIAVAGMSDARPRGIYLRAEEISTEDEESSALITLMEAKGRGGDANIGMSVEGFCVSDKYCLVTGKSVRQDLDYEDNEQSNIFITRVSKSEINEKYMQTTWLTDYPEGSDIQIVYQKMLKYADNKFLLLWQEKDKDGDCLVKYVFLDGDGETIKTTPKSDENGIVTVSGRLSSADPLLSSDKKVLYWAMTEADGEPIELWSMELSTPPVKK